MEHTIDAVIERIKGLEGLLDAQGQSLRDLKVSFRETHDVLTALNARFEIPGHSQWCVEHLKRLEKMESDIEKLRTRLNVAFGGLSVFAFVVPLVIRYILP